MFCFHILEIFFSDGDINEAIQKQNEKVWNIIDKLDQGHPSKKNFQKFREIAPKPPVIIKTEPPTDTENSNSKFNTLILDYQFPLAKASLKKVVKKSGNPLSRIKMDSETKMFICEICQDVDEKSSSSGFQSPMKFELINHFLDFHNDLICGK